MPTWGTSLIHRRLNVLAAVRDRQEVVAKESTVFIVEMYTPGQIVEARRTVGAETATDALRAAMGWINDGGHDAASVRVLDTVGTIMFDTPVAKLK